MATNEVISEYSRRVTSSLPLRGEMLPECRCFCTTSKSWNCARICELYMVADTSTTRVFDACTRTIASSCCTLHPLIHGKTGAYSPRWHVAFFSIDFRSSLTNLVSQASICLIAAKTSLQMLLFYWSLAEIPFPTPNLKNGKIENVLHLSSWWGWNLTFPKFFLVSVF